MADLYGGEEQEVKNYIVYSHSEVVEAANVYSGSGQMITILHLNIDRARELGSRALKERGIEMRLNSRVRLVRIK